MRCVNLQGTTPFVRLLEETQKVHVKVNNKTITFYN